MHWHKIILVININNLLFLLDHLYDMKSLDSYKLHFDPIFLHIILLNHYNMCNLKFKILNYYILDGG